MPKLITRMVAKTAIENNTIIPEEIKVNIGSLATKSLQPITVYFNKKTLDYADFEYLRQDILNQKRKMVRFYTIMSFIVLIILNSAWHISKILKNNTIIQATLYFLFFLLLLH